MSESNITKELVESVREMAGGAVEAAVARNMPQIIASVLRQITASGGWSEDAHSTDVTVRVACSWPGGSRARVKVRAVKWQTRLLNSDTDFEWINIDLQQPDIPGLLGPELLVNEESELVEQVEVDQDRELRAHSMRNLMAAAEKLCLKIYRPCLDPSVPDADRCLELYECWQGAWTWRSSIVPDGGREKILQIADGAGALVIGLDGELTDKSAKILKCADYLVVRLDQDNQVSNYVRCGGGYVWVKRFPPEIGYVNHILSAGDILTPFFLRRG